MSGSGRLGMVGLVMLWRVFGGRFRASVWCRGDAVEVDPVGVGSAGRVERIIGPLAVEPLVRHTLEGVFADAVLAGCADAGHGRGAARGER